MRFLTASFSVSAAAPNSVFNALSEVLKVDLASLKAPLADKKDILNPNNVKVITNKNDFALYFSRSAFALVSNSMETPTAKPTT